MLKQIIDAIGENITLKTTIDTKDDQVTLIIAFQAKVEDSAFDKVAPVSITGTPEEVEQELLEFLKSPSVGGLSETVDQVSAFEKSSAIAAEETKMNSDKKIQVEKLVKKGTDLMEKDEVKKAKTQLKNLQKIDGHEKFKGYINLRDAINKAENPAALPPEDKTEETIVVDFKNKNATIENVPVIEDEKTELDENDFDYVPPADKKLDGDIEVKGSESRAIKYGMGTLDFEQQEAIEQDRLNKLEQDGNTATQEDF